MKLPEIKGYDECNCSVCKMKGYAWVLPNEGHFQFVKGSVGELKSYTFGNGDFTHCVSNVLFTPTGKGWTSTVAAVEWIC